MPAEALKTTSPLVPSARKDGDAVVVAARGEIDLNNSPDLRSELFTILNRHAPKRLILNLAEVPYMDSSAVAVLVETLQKMRKTGGKVYLTNLQPRVQGLIEIARLGTIFVITKDEAEALAKK
jgi:anti-sigma B factor antagonist